MPRKISPEAIRGLEKRNAAGINEASARIAEILRARGGRPGVTPGDDAVEAALEGLPRELWEKTIRIARDKLMGKDKSISPFGIEKSPYR